MQAELDAQLLLMKHLDVKEQLLTQAETELQEIKEFRIQQVQLPPPIPMETIEAELLE